MMVKPELDPLPDQMKQLPVYRHMPVPYFVTYVNGEPEFRATDPGKFWDAVRKRLCWVCGGTLGIWKVFVVGPMCCVTRTSSEPPSHRDCAVWSVRNCPFLSRPQSRRREDEEILAQGVEPGLMIRRNPGVTALWTTREYSLFPDDKGNYLIRMGDPGRKLSFWRERRMATREEIEESVRTGLPALQGLADQDGPVAQHELAAQIHEFRKLLPEV